MTAELWVSILRAGGEHRDDGLRQVRQYFGRSYQRQTFWQTSLTAVADQNWSDAVVRFDRYANRWIISRPGGRNGSDLCVPSPRRPILLGRGISTRLRSITPPITWHLISTITRRSLCFPTLTMRQLIPTKFSADSATRLQLSTISDADRRSGAGVRDLLCAGSANSIHPQPHVGGGPRGHKIAADNTPEVPSCRCRMIPWVFPRTALQVYEFHVNWKDPSSSTLVPTDSLAPEPFNCNACVNQDCIEQPGFPRCSIRFRTVT